MPLFQDKPRPATPAQSLDARPVRMFDAEPREQSPGQWRLTVPYKPVGWAARFLRVRCATGRDFVLSVSGFVRTAREANAWTYGLNETEYELEART